MNSSPSLSQIRVLGIESSCDDTAAAIVRISEHSGEIEAQAVEGQAALHAEFGGVVPEIAARAHAERLDKVTNAIAPDWDAIDLIAVTTGPGLIGGLNAANAFARALSSAKGIPIIGVNHLAGHALTPCLSDGIAPPFLMLLVSGGHCQFLIVHDYDRFERLGTTIDDSPGEAFDKIAKLLGLGYPGGPEIETMAKSGNPNAYKLPRPLLDREGYDLSFSGLKTATRRVVDGFLAKGGMTRSERADLCASFQMAVADVLAEKARRALAAFRALYPETAPVLAVAGGVAANQTIRAALDEIAQNASASLVAPPLSLCTDNAAMIAYAGGIRYLMGASDPADLIARPRWPLDSAAAPMIGSGKKGAKA